MFEAASTFLFFSILPVSRIADYCRTRVPEADYRLNIVQYYYLPLVGAVNAGLAVGLAFTLTHFHYPALLAAALGGILYPLLYGLIHYDGVADCFDAMHAYGKDRFLVLTDPHAGALGILYASFIALMQVALTTTLLYAAVTTMPSAWLGLVLPAMAARVGSFYILVKHYPDQHPKSLEHLFPSYHPQAWLDFAYKAYCVLLPCAVSLLVFLLPSTIVPLVLSTLATAFVSRYVMTASVRVLGFAYGDQLGLCIVLTEILAAFLLIPYYTV